MYTYEVIRLNKVLVVSKEWVNLRLSNKNKNPKTSDASQFHQPPQVPSWSAHHAPNPKAKVVNLVRKKFLYL
jgi:hypothetical protein